LNDLFKLGTASEYLLLTMLSQTLDELFEFIENNEAFVICVCLGNNVMDTFEVAPFLLFGHNLEKIFDGDAFVCEHIHLGCLTEHIEQSCVFHF